jgi:hypothetical protein
VVRPGRAACDAIELLTLHHLHHKEHTMTANSTYHRASLLACSVLLATAARSAAQSPIVVTTAAGLGADVAMNETLNTGTMAVTYGYNAGGVNISVRYNGYNLGFPALDPQGDADNDDRNEFAVLRFDLTGVQKSTISDPALRFIAHRATNNRQSLRLWGVNTGVANLNTFLEAGGSYAATPGFLAGDSDMTTQGVDQAQTTYLGDFAFPQIDKGAGLVDPVEGDPLILSQAVIDATGGNGTSEPSGGSQTGGGVAVQNTLQGFLRSLADSDTAVFILGGIASNGQVRITTKEATTTETSVLTGNAGDFAPRLEYFTGAVGVEDADFDNDMDVDGADFITWQQGLGGAGSSNMTGDADGSGAVDAADLEIWTRKFGTPQSVGAAASVPEPAAAAIAALAIAAFARQRRTAAGSM